MVGKWKVFSRMQRKLMHQQHRLIRQTAYDPQTCSPGDLKFKDQNKDGVIDLNDR